jgi:CRP-like cAMP-binding protein
VAKTSHETKAEALARMPLFEGLSRKDLIEVAKVTEDMEIPAGKVLCEQGEIGHEFFVLLEGEVDVTRDGQHVATLGPGEMFGEIALIERSRRTATVTAKKPLRFFVMTGPAFWALIDRHRDIEREVLRTLALRVLADYKRIPD